MPAVLGPLLASLRKLLRVYCLLCEGGVQQLTLWAVGTSICHHLRVRSSLSLAGLLLRRRRPVRGGFGGILRGPRENAGKTRTRHSHELDFKLWSVELRPSQAVLVIASTRALQRGRPTTPKPPMAVRFVATEILGSADGLSARRA